MKSTEFYRQVRKLAGRIYEGADGFQVKRIDNKRAIIDYYKCGKLVASYLVATYQLCGYEGLRVKRCPSDSVR